MSNQGKKRDKSLSQWREETHDESDCLHKIRSPDGLQLREVARPAPRDDEVLIRVEAATVTAGDSEMCRLQFPIWLVLPIRIWLGFLKPREKILGQELAGEVEAVGKNVKQFRKGDQVFAAAGMALGGYAEYACLPSSAAIAIKSASMTYEEAALPVAGIEALHFLRQASIQPGEKVLVNGAGGSIGTVAVQLARSFGAEVTAVDSTAKLDMLRSIGADHIIDCTQENFTKRGETYDVIFDGVGKTSFSGSKRSLKHNGRYLLANAGLSQMVRGWWTSRVHTKKVIMGTANQNTEDLIFLTELVEAGKLKSVIDKRYPLEQTAEAHRYVDSGQKTGNVVISVAHHHKT